MRFSFLLPIIVLLHNATGGIASGWQRSNSPEPSTTGQTILTPDFVKAVQDAIDTNEIPGLTLAIVRTNGPTEFGAWGINSEDGTNMTTDVRRTLGIYKRREWDDNIFHRRYSISPLAQRRSSPLLWGF